MPTFEIKSPSGKTYEVNAPEGATLDDAIEYVAEELEPSLMSDVSPGPTTSVTDPLDDTPAIETPPPPESVLAIPEKEEAEKRQGIFESEQLQFLNPLVAPVTDVPLKFAEGATAGVRFLADSLGANNELSQSLKGIEEDIGSLLSAGSKNDSQEMARIMKEAEDKGTADQVRAALKAFSVAPVDVLSNALGTAAPAIIATVGTAVLGAPTAVGVGVLTAVGSVQGAGIIKSAIYEGTKKALLEAKVPEEEAEKRAQLAQEYGGENLDLILIGTGLGGAASRFGIDKALAGPIAKRILGDALMKGSTTKGALKEGFLKKYGSAALIEGIPEAAQGGFEQYAENVALQREGFTDVPSARGVAGAATLEGVAGAGLGVGVKRLTPDDKGVELKEEVKAIEARSVSDITEAQEVAKKQRIADIQEEEGVDETEATKIYNTQLKEAQEKDVEEQPEQPKQKPDELVSGRVEPSLFANNRRKAGVGDTTQLEEFDRSGVGLARSDVVGDRDAERRIDDPVKLQTEINKTRNQIRKDESALADPVAMREKVEFENSTEEAVTARLEKDIQQNKLELSNLEAQKKPEIRSTEVELEQQREGSVVKELIDAEPLKNIFRRVFSEEKTKVGVTPADVKDFKKVFGRYLSTSKEFQKLDEKLQNAIIKKVMLDERLESVGRIKAPQVYELRKQSSKASNALDSIYEKTYKQKRPIAFNETPKEYQEAVNAVSELGGVYRAAIGDDPTNIITVDNKAQIDLTDSFPELIRKEEATPTTEVKQETQSITPEEVGETPKEIAEINKFIDQQEKKAEAGQPKFEKATPKAKAEISQGILKQKSYANAKKLSESSLTDLGENTRTGLLKIMTLRQIDESLPKVLVGAAKKVTQLKFIKNAISVAVEKIPAYRNKLMREAQPVVELIQDIIADSELGQSEAENLQVVMKEATIAQVDPSTREGRIVDPDLAKAFDALSPKAKQTYKAIRNYYKQQMKGVVDDIKQGARAVLDPELDAEAIAKIDALVDEQFGKALKIKPYFPLRRFGNFWFQVGEDSDPDKEFYTFESKSERNKFINMRRKELAEQGIAKKFDSGTDFVKNMGQKLDNPGFELLRQIEDRIDSIGSQENIQSKELFAQELKDNLQQLSYLMMPEGNFRKMFINRKGIKGASSDLLRVFSTSAVNLAYQRTRVRYSQQFNQNMADGIKAVSALPAGDQKDFYQKVTAEINRPERRSQILGLEPTGTSQAIANMMTNLGFFTFLSSPSSAALNVFGMTAIGIPMASTKYGYAKITGALTKYIGYYSATPIRQIPAKDENGRPAVRSIVPDLGKSPDLTPIQRKAYEKLVEDNVIDTSYTYDITGMTEKPVPLDESNTEKFMRYSSALFHHSERMNRSALGLAIFDAAYEKTGSFEFAIQEAKDITFRALGDFTRATKAPIFSTPIFKVLLQFKSYPLQMTYIMLRDFKVMTGITNDITPQVMESQLREDGVSEEEIAQAVTAYKKEMRQFKKEAAKNFFGVMGLTTVIGGLTAGFPLYTAMATLIETISQIDDEDEPYEPIYDFDTWFYNWMTTEMGLNNRVAAAVIRGVPAEYAGLGLSDRVSLDILKLWFRDGLDKGDSENYLQSLIINNLGPTVSIGLNLGKASNFLRDGEWYRAVEVLAPAIVKSPMMSARYAEEGAKTRSGEFYVKPKDLTEVDLLIRALGFAPEKVLREQKAMIKRKEVQSKAQQEKTRIHKSLYLAAGNGDLLEVNRIIEKAKRFNKKYPSDPITPDSIYNSISGKTRSLVEKGAFGGVNKKYFLILQDKVKALGSDE